MIQRRAHAIDDKSHRIQEIALSRAVPPHQERERTQFHIALGDAFVVAQAEASYKRAHVVD
jgi:hypothetical protein